MRLIAPATRSRPSFSGTGDGQVRSDLHHDVARQFVSPISGMIATAAPTRGRTKYQGRVGLAQANWVTKPERYSRLGSEVTMIPSSFSSVINRRARSTRRSNSPAVNLATSRRLTVFMPGPFRFEPDSRYARRWIRGSQQVRWHG